MQEQISYFALVPRGRPDTEADGLVRRRIAANGAFTDEGLGPDFGWHFTSALAEWSGHTYPEEIVRIDETRAHQLIDRFRTLWATGDPPTG